MPVQLYSYIVSLAVYALWCGLGWGWVQCHVKQTRYVVRCLVQKQ